MQWYHVLLITMAGVSLAASWKMPRCRLWIGALAMSYVISVAYYRLSPFYDGWHPHGSMIAFFTDALVFLIIRETHQERWEIATIGTVMIVSTSINLFQLSGYVWGFPPMLGQEAYSILLELLNAIYLLFIGGAGLMDHVDRKNTRRGLSRYRRGGLVAACINLFSKAREESKVRQPLRKW